MDEPIVSQPVFLQAETAGQSSASTRQLWIRGSRLHVDPHFVERYCRDFIYEGIMAPVPALNELPRKEMQA